MKTNDIKITQRAEYYYTAIDLFQTVHQNRSVLGVLGCKADAQKLLRCCFFFLLLAPAFLPAGEGCATAELLKCSQHLPVLLQPPFAWLSRTLFSCLHVDSHETEIYRRGF